MPHAGTEPMNSKQKHINEKYSLPVLSAILLIRIILNPGYIPARKGIVNQDIFFEFLKIYLFFLGVAYILNLG